MPRSRRSVAAARSAIPDQHGTLDRHDTDRGATMAGIHVEQTIAAGFAALLLAAACASPQPQASSDSRAAALVADRGCDTCHARKAPPLGKGPVSVAPAWHEVAARYRSQPGAEAALVAVLIGGTEERHWKGEPLVSMLPHEQWITGDEARALVRWIVAQ